MVVEEIVVWQMFFMFLGAGILAAIFGILVVILSMWTPAWVFLKAKMKNQPILAARRRDRKIHFHRAEKYIEGLAISTKYKAGFIIDPDSVYTDSKSGASILPVNLEVGITLSEKVLLMIEGLKRMGLNNIDEAERLNELHGKCECGYEGFMVPTLDDKGNVIKVSCPYAEMKEKQADEEAEHVQEKEAGTAAGAG